jgi:hypothetical protein
MLSDLFGIGLCDNITKGNGSARAIYFGDHTKIWHSKTCAHSNICLSAPISMYVSYTLANRKN